MFWVPIALYCSARVLSEEPSRLKSVGVMGAGVIVWQFLEYLVHRYAFHFEPQQPWSIVIHFLLHGHHHKYPLDKYRLVFPVPVAAIAMSIIFSVCNALFPKVRSRF